MIKLICCYIGGGVKDDKWVTPKLHLSAGVRCPKEECPSTDEFPRWSAICVL